MITKKNNIMTKYYIALGSNLETKNMTRLEILNKALEYFSLFKISLLKVSSFWESKSYPNKNQPNFINAVSEVQSKLNPYQTLSSLKKIESLLGRKINGRWGNRVLDLDILAAGSLILPNLLIFKKWQKMPLHLQIQNQPKQLILPHPRIQDRLFVLKPLSEINQDWMHPVLNKKTFELIDGNNWNEENLLSLVDNKKFNL